MAVTLTEAAAKHVQKFLTRRGKGVGLRLGVKTSGCSGMAYKLEFADEVNSDDQVWESFGVKVIVDEKSLPYLDGTSSTIPAKASRRASSSTTRMKRAAAAAASPSTFDGSSGIRTKGGSPFWQEKHRKNRRWRR